MNKYWQNALTLSDYLELTEQRLVNNTDVTDPHQEYYELGLHRMQRTLKTFKPDPAQLDALEKKQFKGKILIISEPWCGDASATVPAVTQFFQQAGSEVRIFLRDSDPTLINQYLTAGTQSIPIVLVMNDDFTLRAVWGPRPKYGTELLAKFKADEAACPREDFYNDLQVYYAKNKGHDAIEEILNLI